MTPSTDDDQLIDDVLAVLPEFGRNVFRGLAADPLAEGRSLGQMKVLACLVQRGRLPVKDVAATIGVQMPTASELIEKLVADGLVVREVNPADRRQVLVDLTDTAAPFSERFVALRRAQVRYALEAMEPHERPVFVKALSTWAKALSLSESKLVELTAELTEPIRTPT
jgi:DNA-binding MarR family transcriptional regulator